MPIEPEETEQPSSEPIGRRLHASSRPPQVEPTVIQTPHGPVGIRVHDPNYRQTEAWLESQRRQQLSGGAFGGEKNQERILTLVDEIRQFDYDRYATPIKYARLWGISTKYVRLLCTEALRLCREEVEDPDYAKATVLEALAYVIKNNIKKPGVGHQTLVVKACKVFAEIAGVQAPVEVRLSRGNDDLPNDPVLLRRMAAEAAGLLGQYDRTIAGVIDAQGTSDTGSGQPVAPETADGTED